MTLIIFFKKLEDTKSKKIYIFLIYFQNKIFDNFLFFLTKKVEEINLI